MAMVPDVLEPEITQLPVHVTGAEGGGVVSRVALCATLITDGAGPDPEPVSQPRIGITEHTRRVSLTAAAPEFSRVGANMLSTYWLFRGFP